MIKKLLSVCLSILITNQCCYALTGQEPIVDTTKEEAAPIANEEIRKLKKDVQDTSDSLTTSIAAVNVLTTLGDILYYGTANTRLAGNTTTAKKFLSQTGTGSASAPPVWESITSTSAVGSFTRETNETADQDINTVGFQASVCIFLTAQNTGDNVPLSIGFDNGTTAASVYHNYDVASIPNYFLADSEQSIVYENGSATRSRAKISAFDSDGFTLDWTVTGGSGEARIIYLCLK